MSAWSTVALTLRKQDMLQLIREAKESNVEAFNLLREAELTEHGEEYATLYWAGVPWFSWEESDGVAFVEAFYKPHSVQELREYCFLRVGETVEDIEVDYHFDFNSDICEFANISIELSVQNRPENLCSVDEYLAAHPEEAAPASIPTEKPARKEADVMCNMHEYIASGNEICVTLTDDAKFTGEVIDCGKTGFVLSEDGDTDDVMYIYYEAVADVHFA